MSKIKTHKEMLDRIIEGYEKDGVKYNQRLFFFPDFNEDYPCGTQFCLLGALVTSTWHNDRGNEFFLSRSSQKPFYFLEFVSSDTVYELAEYDIALFWKNVFILSNDTQAFKMLLSMETWDSYPEFKESLEKLFSVIDPDGLIRRIVKQTM